MPAVDIRRERVLTLSSSSSIPGVPSLSAAREAGQRRTGSSTLKTKLIPALVTASAIAIASP